MHAAIAIGNRQQWDGPYETCLRQYRKYGRAIVRAVRDIGCALGDGESFHPQDPRTASSGLLLQAKLPLNRETFTEMYEVFGVYTSWVTRVR